MRDRRSPPSPLPPPSQRRKPAKLPLVSTCLLVWQLLESIDHSMPFSMYMLSLACLICRLMCVGLTRDCRNTSLSKIVISWLGRCRLLSARNVLEVHACHMTPLAPSGLLGTLLSIRPISDVLILAPEVRHKSCTVMSESWLIASLSINHMLWRMTDIQRYVAAARFLPVS